MSQVITATFEDGVLKPDQPLELPDQGRVRLVIEPLDTLPDDKEKLWEEFERLSDEISIDSGGIRMTRDQLHERD